MEVSGDPIWLLLTFASFLWPSSNLCGSVVGNPLVMGKLNLSKLPAVLWTLVAEDTVPRHRILWCEIPLSVVPYGCNYGTLSMVYGIGMYGYPTDWPGRLYIGW